MGHSHGLKVPPATYLLTPRKNSNFIVEKLDKNCLNKLIQVNEMNQSVGLLIGHKEPNIISLLCSSCQRCMIWMSSWGSIRQNQTEDILKITDLYVSKSRKSRKDGRTIPKWRLKRQDNQPQPVILNWIPLQEQLCNHKSADSRRGWGHLQNPVGVDEGRRGKRPLELVQPVSSTGRTSSSTLEGCPEIHGEALTKELIHIRIKGAGASEQYVMTNNRSQMFVSGAMAH